MATIGSLWVNVGARTGRFRKGMRKASKRLSTFQMEVARVNARAHAFQAGMDKMALAVKGFGLLAVALAIKKTIDFTRASMDLIDATAKTADKLGLTTEMLTGLRHAAELSGVNVRTFDMGIQRMTRRIAEAAQGTGEAKAALHELGVDAKRLAGMTVDQQFYALADAMEKVTSQGDRVRLGFKLFDSEGVALINTLRGGSAALNSAQREAERLGFTIDRQTAAKVEAANNAFTRMKGAVTGLGYTLISALAPALEGSAVFLTGVLSAVQDTMRAFRQLDGLISSGFGGKTLAELEEEDRYYAQLAVRVKQREAAILRQRAIKAKAAAEASALRAAEMREIEMRWRSEQSAARSAARAVMKPVEVYRERLAQIKRWYREERITAMEHFRLMAVAERDYASARDPKQEKGVANHMRRLRGMGDALRDQVRTPLERFHTDAARFNELLNSGIITVTTYDRAMAKSRDTLAEYYADQRRAAGIKTPQEKMKEYLESLKGPAAAVFEQTRTPMERFNAEVAKLNEMLNSGVIAEETWQRAMERAKKTLADFHERQRAAKAETRTALAQQFDQARMSIKAYTSGAMQQVHDPANDKIVSELRGLRSDLADGLDARAT